MAVLLAAGGCLLLLLQLGEAFGLTEFARHLLCDLGLGHLPFVPLESCGAMHSAELGSHVLGICTPIGPLSSYDTRILRAFYEFFCKLVCLAWTIEVGKRRCVGRDPLITRRLMRGAKGFGLLGQGWLTACRWQSGIHRRVVWTMGLARLVGHGRTGCNGNLLCPQPSPQS